MFEVWRYNTRFQGRGGYRDLILRTPNNFYIRFESGGFLANFGKSIFTLFHIGNYIYLESFDTKEEAYRKYGFK